MNDEYMKIDRPVVDGVPMTTAHVEKVWNALVTVEGGPEVDALAAILRAVHFGLRQRGV
jgi:hypothetical protein